MQSPATEKKIRDRFTCPQLPLAVYREVAAHLRQVAGVESGLISRPLKKAGASSDKQTISFDYKESQIQALWIEHSASLGDREKRQIQEILDYYAARYSPWQR